MIKRSLIWTALAQVLIFIFCIIFYQKISLLPYINISFIIGTILILYALAVYVIRGRFFDLTFYSFQYIFSRMSDKERRPLSELAPQKFAVPFTAGTITLILMVIAMLFYQL